ncbi:proteic killer suppression protein [Collimonas sp. OK607]|uniref:type II toxin-antitoxin system RelE/ParE family toxin n=1 Tax=Collimonas sp. OK607 TaxID=1798194 RepID=UPI0008E32DA9|nr:type II toxin-antitoxin system RelE/ParE family toxin [Collimonas sp. OK607]SFA91223.1 proteic killer suppression protein [Collimonas sp. OK607]
MILSFRCGDTQTLFEGKRVAKFANIANVAERKLQQLDSAVTLNFLRSPPGNRLEALVGNRAGKYSIRVNEQWRICFVWTDQGVENVEMVDYH